MKKPTKKKARKRPAKYVVRIGSVEVEAVSITLAARDPKGKLLFRYTYAEGKVTGL